MTNSLVGKHLQAVCCLGLLAVVGSLSACTPEAPPPPVVEIESLSDTQRQAITDAYLAESWATVISEFPNAEMPVAQRVRYVTLNEWPEVNAECLRGKGFDVLVSDTGGVTMMINVAQREAAALAEYACDVEFPPDPVTQQPLNESQLRYLYWYFTNTLTPCLEGAGHQVTEPPSITVFIESYYSPQAWSPYLSVTGEGDLDWSSLNKKCPQQPNGLYGPTGSRP